jgi:septum formation protein
MRKIVLASASPRRRELLAKIGLKFEVALSNHVEESHGDLEPHVLAKQLSLEKATAVAAKYPDAIIIAADTFGVLDGKIIGKPHTNAEAIKMLRMLSGRSHLVITGFTILDTARKKRVSRFIETKVYFRKLTDAEIDAYVRTGEPLDKAGAYAIQGLGALLVEKIEGDYYNVIGLPLSAVTANLKQFGVNVL